MQQQQQLAYLPLARSSHKLKRGDQSVSQLGCCCYYSNGQELLRYTLKHRDESLSSAIEEVKIREDSVVVIVVCAVFGAPFNSKVSRPAAAAEWRRFSCFGQERKKERKIRWAAAAAAAVTDGGDGSQSSVFLLKKGAILLPSSLSAAGGACYSIDLRQNTCV
jgi:hypothetical protein